MMKQGLALVAVGFVCKLKPTSRRIDSLFYAYLFILSDLTAFSNPKPADGVLPPDLTIA